MILKEIINLLKALSKKDILAKWIQIGRYINNNEEEYNRKYAELEKYIKDHPEEYKEGDAAAKALKQLLDIQILNKKKRRYVNHKRVSPFLY